MTTVKTFSKTSLNAMQFLGRVFISCTDTVVLSFTTQEMTLGNFGQGDHATFFCLCLQPQARTYHVLSAMRRFLEKQIFEGLFKLGY